MDYEKYLKSRSWAVRRREALRAADHRCAICSGKRNLDVHHRTYDRLGREDPKDLLVLCRECHDLFHEHGRWKKSKLPESLHAKIRSAFETASDREDAYFKIRKLLATAEASEERDQAVEEAATLLRLPSLHVDQIYEAGKRLEWDVLAGCYGHPALLSILQKVGSDHFDHQQYRHIREHLLKGIPTPELASTAADIDEPTARELILRLRERGLRRRLAQERDLARKRDIHRAIVSVREEIAEIV